MCPFASVNKRTDPDGTPYFYLETPNEYYSKYVFKLNIELTWLPKEMYGVKDLCSQTFIKYLKEYYTSKSYIEDTKYISMTYEQYKRCGITKMHTSPYYAISLANNVINYFYSDVEKTRIVPENTTFSQDIPLRIEMLLFPTLTTVSLSVQNLENFDYRTEYFLVNNVTSFKPFVTRSFADSIDIELAGLNAERKEVNAGFGVAKSTLSTGVGIGKIFGGDFQESAGR